MWGITTWQHTEWPHLCWSKIDLYFCATIFTFETLLIYTGTTYMHIIKFSVV